jgi:integrator complex subunit 11
MYMLILFLIAIMPFILSHHFFFNSVHQIHQLSFSPHTDSKGIMDLTEFLSPSHVILVHGEKPQMAFLKDRIESELGMPCYYPANNETVSIPTTHNLKINATEKFITSCTAAQARGGLQDPNLICGNHLPGVGGDAKVAEGILLMEKSKAPKILCEDELLQLLGTERHSVKFEPLLSSRIEEAQTDIVDDV